jgi:hypothetical protein
MWPFRRRRKEQSQPIGEAEAYERSYGDRSKDVRMIKLPPRRPRDKKVLESGEVVRRSFLERLERRHGSGRNDSDG